MLLHIQLAETLAVSEYYMVQTSPYMAYLFLLDTDIRRARFFIDHDVCASQLEQCHSNAECINRRKGSVCSCAPGFNEDIGSCLGKDIKGTKYYSF